MNPVDLTRLHAARMDNDAARFTMDEMRPRFDRLRDRHTNGAAPRVVTAYQLFQTPEAVARRMVELADPRGGLSWLEPSAGLGRLLRPILETSPESVTACEESPEVAGELFAEFPSVTLWQGDFLERQPVPEFERVIMNPPFHMRADIAHILHALKFLKEGGVLVGLCMATPHREKALRGLSDHWETLERAFVKEGTGVPIFLFRIRK